MLILEAKTKTNKSLIEKTCQILASEGLVVVPSDTVYGLVADATNKRAVNGLIEFKRRVSGKAISVFVKSLTQAEKIVSFNKSQKSILENLLPGPFTVILPSRHVLVRELESEKGTLGVRLPRFEFINNLIRRFGRPITATSANISGQSYHYSIQSFLSTLSDKKKQSLDLVIDFGKLPRNKPSTVIDLSAGKLTILRHGDFDLKTNRKFITKTPEQTKRIAQFLFNTYINNICNKPLIFLLEGELGVGKTIFIKGIGEKLGINNIISPSFVIYYEYDVKNGKVDKLYHLDLFMLEELEEFKYLKTEQMLRPRTVVCVEWGEKIGGIFDLLQEKGKIIYVKMKYISAKERELVISNS